MASQAVAGSFDYVRLAFHFAQDDILGEEQKIWVVRRRGAFSDGRSEGFFAPGC
jgi:hypothetical protein